MREINFQVAWFAILIGLITGTVTGLFFHEETWMGGYGTWRRRMMRPGHISFFGTGFLNLAFVVSSDHLRLDQPPPVASAGFVMGALTMPTVCFLSAWRDVQFPAALLLVFALMFLAIARDPLENRSLIIYGILLKLSYCGIAFWYWFSADIPGLWKPFAIIDALMAVLFAWSYRAPGTSSSAALKQA